MENNPRPRHRPYDPDAATVILGQISEGKPLRAICSAEGMPPVGAIFEWLNTTPEFAERYARARSEQADALADEILHLADEKPDRVADEQGNQRVDSGWVQWQRNRVEARKWIAAKLKPKKYGEKIDATLSGADGGPVQFQSIERRIVDPSEGAK